MTANTHSTPSDLHFRASVLSISDSTFFWGTTHFARAAQSGRDRVHTVLHEDLWRPILKRVVPSDPVEKARGLLELFDGVVKSFHPQPMTHSSNWTPAGDWYSRLGRTRELSKSLHLELQFGQVESRRQRYGAGRLLRLNEPRRGTVSFHFALAELPGVDSRCVLVTNLLPSRSASRTRVARKPRGCESRERRISERGARTSTALTRGRLPERLRVSRRDDRRDGDGRQGAVDAICDYLNWDDDRVAAAAESLRFSEFEHLEPALHQ